MVEDETADKAGLGGHLVLHVHDLNHVQVDALVAFNALHGVHNDFGEGVGDRGVDLGVEGGFGNLDQKVAAHLGLLNLEIVQEPQNFTLSLLDTVNDDTWVDTLTNVAFSLAHELTNEEDVGGGAITDDVILSGGCTADHSGSGVLDLHLVEKDATILGELDLASSTNEPKLHQRDI